jgi:hypothetical protein
LRCLLPGWRCAASMKSRHGDGARAGREQHQPQPRQLEATGSEASAFMMRGVVQFNTQLERFAEIGIVMVWCAAWPRWTSSARRAVEACAAVRADSPAGCGWPAGHPGQCPARPADRLVWHTRHWPDLHLLYAISHGLAPALAKDPVDHAGRGRGLGRGARRVGHTTDAAV